MRGAPTSPSPKPRQKAYGRSQQSATQLQRWNISFGPDTFGLGGESDMGEREVARHMANQTSFGKRIRACEPSHVHQSLPIHLFLHVDLANAAGTDEISFQSAIQDRILHLNRPHEDPEVNRLARFSPQDRAQQRAQRACASASHGRYTVKGHSRERASAEVMHVFAVEPRLVEDTELALDAVNDKVEMQEAVGSHCRYGGLVLQAPQKKIVNQSQRSLVSRIQRPHALGCGAMRHSEAITVLLEPRLEDRWIHGVKGIPEDNGCLPRMQPRKHAHVNVRTAVEKCRVPPASGVSVAVPVRRLGPWPSAVACHPDQVGSGRYKLLLRYREHVTQDAHPIAVKGGTRTPCGTRGRTLA
mmetsp:Transcript_28055/g.63499  ORF Transcript_28055/g.63499 Transcript_28055/m.63499 type:complete len:357 (+) Transcript_28055:117-1187(+)